MIFQIENKWGLEMTSEHAIELSIILIAARPTCIYYSEEETLETVERVAIAIRKINIKLSGEE